MARRNQQSDLMEAGSDSFLDIVANIVGILIILIVVAGVRMSEAPVTPAEPVAAMQEPEAELFEVELPKLPELPLPQLISTASVEEQPADTEVSTPKIPDISVELGSGENFVAEEDPHLAAAITAARESRLKLAAEAKTLKANVLATVSDSEEVNRQKLEIETAFQSAKQKLENVKAEEATQLALAAELTRQKAELDRQLVLKKDSATPGEALTHSILPVSKLVDGEEWHFELRGGKVAFIPLNELLDSMQNKVQQRGQWIAQYGDYEGVVGPIAGFSLQFQVSKEKKSLVNDLIEGNGMFRIQLDKWELYPAGERNRETAEAAQQPNSLFVSELQRVSLNDTITFWVYPDSYELYRELVPLVRKRGHQVAARPLPADHKISGSPGGSRSVSQ